MMRGVGLILTSVALILLGGCKSNLYQNNQANYLLKEQPTTITEPAGVRPRYHWEQGYWRWSRKAKSHVWEQGNWSSKRRHTKWVKGHWVDTAKGRRYMEGHWE